MDDQANRSPRLSEQPPDLIAGTVLLQLNVLADIETALMACLKTDGKISSSEYTIEGKVENGKLIKPRITHIDPATRERDFLVFADEATLNVVRGDNRGDAKIHATLVKGIIYPMNDTEIRRPSKVFWGTGPVPMPVPPQLLKGPEVREANVQLKAFPAAFSRRVRHEDPKQRGPELIISLQAPANQSEPAKVNLYAGLATRWRIAGASTQVPGSVRFENLRSTATSANGGGYLVGIKVDHPTLVPADGRSWRDVLVSSKPGTKKNLDIVLADGGFVQGQLKDAAGKPLAGVDLRLLHRAGRDDRFVDYAKTDAEGRFHSAALAAGEYRVERNDAERQLFGTVHVEAGKSVMFERK
jgi:hypothetical protein